MVLLTCTPGTTTQQLSTEFIWQEEAEHNAATFKEEVLVSSSWLPVFGFVQLNLSFVQFMYTFGIFLRSMQHQN
jgi:hypothetical protein